MIIVPSCLQELSTAIWLLPLQDAIISIEVRGPDRQLVIFSLQMTSTTELFSSAGAHHWTLFNALVKEAPSRAIGRWLSTERIYSLFHFMESLASFTVCQRTIFFLKVTPVSCTHGAPSVSHSLSLSLSPSFHVLLKCHSLGRSSWTFYLKLTPHPPSALPIPLLCFIFFVTLVIIWHTCPFDLVRELYRSSPDHPQVSGWICH